MPLHIHACRDNIKHQGSFECPDVGNKMANRIQLFASGLHFYVRLLCYVSTFLAGLRGSQVEVRSSTVVSSLYLNKFFLVRLFFAVMLRGFMPERQQKVWIGVDQKHPNVHSLPSVSALYCCTVTKSVQNFANNLNETTSFSNTSVSSQQMYLWRVAPAVCFAIVPQHLNDPHQSSLQHAASL